MSILKLALLQMPVSEDVDVNLKTAEIYAERAVREAGERRPDVIMLPEMFCCPYEANSFLKNQEPRGGRIWTALRDLARELKVYLIGGSMPERDGGKIYNSCFVFGQDGAELGRHRKMHLFDIDIKGGQRFCESDTLAAGDQVTVIDTEFGRIGVEICFDIRFQELTHLMALEGAKIVFVPAAFNTTTGPRHWDILFRGRAIDSEIFMAGCSPARDMESSYHAYGHSLVVSPWGVILGEMDEKCGILYQEIDLDEVQSVREQIPVMSARRTDIYTLSRN